MQCDIRQSNNFNLNKLNERSVSAIPIIRLLIVNNISYKHCFKNKFYYSIMVSTFHTNLYLLYFLPHNVKHNAEHNSLLRFVLINLSRTIFLVNKVNLLNNAHPHLRAKYTKLPYDTSNYQLKLHLHKAFLGAN